MDGCLAPQVVPLEEHFPLEVKLQEADWETFLFTYTWLDHRQKSLPAKLDEILQDVIDIGDVDGMSVPFQWIRNEIVIGSVLAKGVFSIRMRLKSPSSLLVKLGYWKLQDWNEDHLISYIESKRQFFKQSHVQDCFIFVFDVPS